MRKLVECVPNFSEGRDRVVIDAIAEAIRKAPGCTLLDVDPGASTNRTVYTFVGAPEAVVEGALAGARVARQRIDMRTQQGEHPRDRRARRVPVRARLGRDDGRLRGARERVRPPRGRRARRAGLLVWVRRAGRPPADAAADPGGRVRGPGRADREAGVEAGLRPGRLRARVGRHLRRRARLPDRLQRQHPGDQGAGAPDRPRHPRGRARPGAAGKAEGRARDRLVGRGVRAGAGLDQPRGLPDDAAARRVRGLRGGSAHARARGRGLGARRPDPAPGAARWPPITTSRARVSSSWTSARRSGSRSSGWACRRFRLSSPASASSSTWCRSRTTSRSRR